MNRIFPLSARDKVLAITTFSFDISLLEIFLPLAAGARIFLAGKTDVVNGDRLCNIINEQQITFLQATPTTWRMLLFSGRPTLNSLTALCGGEALSESLKKELVQNVKYLWNMYGPTETTVWSTCFQIMDENTPVLIGKPIDNTQLYILDELLQPVPKGVTGDLYIGGAGLSAGYLKQPELTAESFIPDPFSEDAGSRIYKTGDLARMNASGDFQCLGRTGSQVKIRGYRIELGEIENALVLLHNINEVVCTVWERSEYDKQIVAYYRADKEIRHEELIEHLRQSLPNYMIPGFFIFLHDFPKTPNAKTDRKRLPPPEEKVQRVILKSKPEALSSSLENEILIIWKDVLKHENINRKDDFFNIGGHSLLAIDLIQKMNDRIGEYWLLGDLFSNPTVEKLGKLAQDKLPKSTDFVVCLQSEGKKDPIFCVLGMNLYRELAMSMGKTRPVYGLFLPIEQKLINNIREGKYIENKQLTAGEMARDYIREIKKIKPEGPYHILGVSYGGVVAFEIIRQLEIMGELPGSLFMLDTRLSKGISRNWSLYVKHKSRYLFSSCLVQNIRSGLEKAKLIFSQRLDPLKLASKSNELTEDEIVKLRGNVYYRLTRLFESQFNIYNGSAHLFIAEDCQITPWVSYKPDLGWSNYIKGELKIHPVPGDHLGILKKPNVELIAKKINSSLP
jgi:thioesterase domain-containing protein